MIEYKVGDIVKNNYTIFCHQVNCCHKMGSGLAKQIRKAYPEVYKEYMNVENPMLGYILPVFTHDGRICINMFAQDGYGKDGKQYTNYEAFNNCLRALFGFIADHHIKKDVTIAFPYGIGCGLGGGNWFVIRNMIRSFAEVVQQKVVIVKHK